MKAFIYSIISVFVLFFVEQFLEVNYVIKTITKIGLFLIIPIVITKNLAFLKRSTSSWSSRIVTISIAFSGFFGIFIAYWILQNYIDPVAIVTDLTVRLEISPTTFIFVGMYICLCNSFIEEFFFRGWLIQMLSPFSRIGAYTISSLLFAIYHIAIFITWFHWGITLLALVGLFIVGFIFCLVNEKSKSIYHSWFIHFMANVAIIIIGLQLFSLI